MRGWRDEDFEPWAEICADDEVMRSLGWDGGIGAGEAWGEMAFFAGHWILKGFGHWVLEERSSGALVGRAGLLRPPDWPDLEVGWTVARSRWGQGLAGEAGRAAIDWAHDVLGARHVISLIAPDNTRSQRVAEKLGLEEEGATELRGHALAIWGGDLPLTGGDSAARGTGTRTT
jgi:RimJ/RimL family protein N-acetyltransferase